MRFQTLKELYEHSITVYADRVANSMYERETLTYAAFGERVRTLQEMLLESGLSAGDKVALLSSSMPNWAVCYFAVTSLGMVIVPILPGFSSDEFDMIIRHSEAKALLVSDRLYSKISREVIGTLNVVIRTKNLGIIARKEGLFRGTASEPKPDDTAAIIYTSGTTSRSKGVMLSHKALCNQVDGSYGLFPITADDIFLSILPISHTYECSVGMLYPFAFGAQVVYIDRPPTGAVLVPILHSVRPTIMLSVPLVIDKLYRSQVLARFSKSAFLRHIYSRSFWRRRIHRMAGRKLMKVFGGRLRFFGVGGAKLDPQTERFLIEAQFPYAVGYGLTETAPLLAGFAPFDGRPGSTGKAMDTVTLRIAEPNERGEGELQAITPSVMQGYFKNPEATAAAFTADGWFRTNDLCCFDADGFLYVKGRMNNVLVGPSGENIYPEEIESVLNSLTYVSESLVTEEDGKLVALVRFDYEELQRKWAEIKESFILRGERMATDVEGVKNELMAYVNSKVNSFSKISKVEEHAEEFEKTPTMKIKRFKYMRAKK